MSTKVVLFDLDGTLLPMDFDVYLKDYFVRLAKKMAENGYNPDLLMKGIYAGMNAMINNDGSCTNEEALWREIIAVFGEDVKKDVPLFDEYYANEFQEVKKSCGFNPEAAKAVRMIKDKGYRVVLATNPMYPRAATESRVHWAGLEPEDFEIVTTYEDYCSCKPNTKYYEEVLEKIGVKPEECLMVGNDVEEDMIAETLGMKVFLMPADLINKYDKDITKYPQGDFADLLAYIDTL